MNGILFVIIIMAIPVISVFGFGAFKTWIRHEERKIALMGPQANSALNNSQIEELRREISSVRQTSTEYDMSIQHTLEQIQRRLDYLEASQTPGKLYGSSTTQPAEEVRLTAGQRSTSSVDWQASN